MASRLKTRLAKKLFLKTLAGLHEGSLNLICPESTYQFGDNSGKFLAGPRAVVAVHNDDFFLRALTAGDMGIGEAYMAGDWSTPDLVEVVRLAVRNMTHLDGSNRFFTALRRMADWLEHRRNTNSVSGSRKNIAYHYDLGNAFYETFLDQRMVYSSAMFDRGDESLETAQLNKFDRICQKLSLERTDHLLEIGTGWGGFAIYAAEKYGCRVTTTTISRAQHGYAAAKIARSDANGRIHLLLEDYRNLVGDFDKIVSIEMLEAVGYAHYDDFFGTCDKLLKPDGSVLIQTITIAESKVRKYRKQSDWIKKHIFPGAELTSIAEIQKSLVRATHMRIMHTEDIGADYALTLQEWGRRFRLNLGEVRRQGFDERFIRMWEYYLAYCEGAFRECYIGDAQLLMGKATSRNSFMNYPDRESICQEFQK
jgi:cyclopropane-fatty-acyl-phospholipid synthase